MLHRITHKQFLDWKEFDRTSPIGDIHGDWRAASICAAFTNVILASRGVKKRVKVSDFMLEFGDAKDYMAPRQTWQEQKMIGQMIALAFTEPRRKKDDNG